MKLYGFYLLFLVTTFLFTSSFCYAADFPYRKYYADVPVLELTQAKKAYDTGEAVIVDIRSRMEFETIRVKNAVNIDFSMLTYLSSLQQLGRDNPGKKIIVYDNGITSVKSYISVQDALDAGMDNTLAYDGGIQAWAEKYPQDILLMGKQLENPADELIPYERYEKILLDFESFRQKISEATSAKIIDARDPKQRTDKIIGFEDALPIPLDKLIVNIISKGHMKNDQLFVFDQVGGQVRWLMYYLEKQGYKNYFFLKGGATAVINEQHYREK